MALSCGRLRVFPNVTSAIPYAHGHSTTPDNPGRADIPPGFWEREDSHNPRPMTPLGSSIFVDGLNQSFPKVFASSASSWRRSRSARLGATSTTPRFPLGGKVGDKPRGLPPAPALWLALRTVPVFRRRLAVCKQAMRTRADVKLVDWWSMNGARVSAWISRASAT